jgi:acyl dehydratase
MAGTRTGAAMLPSVPRLELATMLASARHRGRPEGLAQPYEDRCTMRPLDAGHLARFRAFFDWPATAEVPIGYWYLPAARAHLQALLDPRFGYRLLGMVHVTCRIAASVTARPVSALVLDTRVAPERQPESAHEYVSLVTRISDEGGALLASCECLYLARRAPSGESRRAGAAPSPQAATAPAAVDTQADPAHQGRAFLGPDYGRRYAALSGDYNPIHLWPLTARPFGFPRPIAHGMSTVNGALSLVERDLGRPVSSLHARFVRPFALPGGLQATWRDGGFEIRDGQRTTASGTYAAD